MTKQQKISLLHVMNIRDFVVKNMRIVNIRCGPSVVLAPFVQRLKVKGMFIVEGALS